MIFHTVYRTQNLVNGKYYFGVHKTKNPYDNYLGSGKVLKRAVEKYGEQSFIKNVCFIFDNAEEAFAKEFELIETYRGDRLCYNLRQGGSGGFDWINREGRNIVNNTPGRMAALETLREDVIKNARRRAASVRNAKTINSTPEIKERARAAIVKFWTGRRHKQESLIAISAAAKKRTGNKNSQFGSCWIVKDGVNRKIKKEDLPNWQMMGWVLGRKIKCS